MERVTDTHRQIIQDNLAKAAENVKNVEHSTQDPESRNVTYHVNEEALEALLRTFYDQSKHVMPYANNALQLATFLCSLHGENSYLGFQLAFRFANLPEQYALIQSVIMISANVGESFDDYGFPTTFNRDNTLNAVFKLLADLKYPQYDVLLEKFRKKFSDIADSHFRNEKDPKVQEALFAAFNDFIKEVLTKPECIPDPIRYVMMNFSAVTDKVAPDLPEDKRISYFSIFLFTRFMIPRLTRMTDRHSPLLDSRRTFLSQNVSSQIQALATNQKKAQSYLFTSKDAVKNMIATLCMFDPTMETNISLRQRYVELLDRYTATRLFSPRSRSADTTDIGMPTLKEVDTLIEKCSKDRKGSLTQLKADCEKLRSDIRSNLLESILHWMHYYGERRLSPHAQKAENKAIMEVLKTHISAIQKQPIREAKIFALFLAVKESRVIPYCREVIGFLEGRLSYTPKQLEEVIDDPSLHTETNLKATIMGDLKSAQETVLEKLKIEAFGVIKTNC